MDEDSLTGCEYYGLEGALKSNRYGYETMLLFGGILPSAWLELIGADRSVIAFCIKFSCTAHLIPA